MMLYFLFGFLSTPSARRATSPRWCRRCPAKYFYPRPPRGERRRRASAGRLCPHFYPRPPRGERPRLLSSVSWKVEFLSTPSARRATDHHGRVHRRSDISIHALREESDAAARLRAGQQRHFYPRPPRGERQQKQRENTLLLSHYTPLCTNCKEMSVNQTAKSHRYLRKRLVFRCEASRETMCAAGSHWPDIKRSARCLGQILGAVQCARPWSGSCCPAGRTADCPRQGRSGRSALL